MRALHRKLFRDLWEIKGQALAIALVIAAGIAMFVTYLSNFQSLRLTQEAYYEHYRFADVFAAAKRAPERLLVQIVEIPGVARADARVVVEVTLDVPEVTEPVVGRIQSLGRDPGSLNAIALQEGRLPQPDRPEEVLVSEGFALARGLGPGDTLAAIVNGRRRELEIVGLALSPEFVYTIRPGALMPDDERYGVFWMDHDALATAFDMKGGFNDVALKLMPGASADEVIDRLDDLLRPWGGLGAMPRSLQPSHWYVDSELQGLQTVGFILPVIFLGVAAFLLNVVLQRIIAVQREQIAALKALGYTDFEVGLHYGSWSVVIAAVGGLVGVSSGAWLGRQMAGLYNEFFRFPTLEYEVSSTVLAGTVVFSAIAAVAGALGSVGRAVRLPPAEAMRPQAPGIYRPTLVERLGFGRWLSEPARMVLRNLERRPGRALASIVGIAFSAAMLIVGLFFLDSIEELLDVQFGVLQRQDVTVSFVEPLSSGARFGVQQLPGVLASETTRSVAVRLRAGHRERQSSILGLAAGARLQRVVDTSLEEIRLPPEGLVLSRKLAEILELEAGDVVTVEVLEGRRPVERIRIAALVEEYMGTSAYMEAGALHRMLKEGENVSSAMLLVDSSFLDELYSRLKRTPAVAGVAIQEAAIRSFRDTIGQNLGIMVFFNVLFAGIIAFGVVYNAARVSLSERSRELASLRVLGFTRAEISSILIGELATLTAVAIPLGLAIGTALSAWIVAIYDTELYRFPLVIWPRTYASAALVVIVATVVSSLVVRRKLHRLDLVGVLKTRE